MTDTNTTNTATKKAATPAAQRYYIDVDEKRIVKASSNTAAINHFWAPKVRVATTDEVLSFKDSGGTVEVAA